MRFEWNVIFRINLPHNPYAASIIVMKFDRTIQRTTPINYNMALTSLRQ